MPERQASVSRGSWEKADGKIGLAVFQSSVAGGYPGLRLGPRRAQRLSRRCSGVNKRLRLPQIACGPATNAAVPTPETVCSNRRGFVPLRPYRLQDLLSV